MPSLPGHPRAPSLPGAASFRFSAGDSADFVLAPYIQVLKGRMHQRKVSESKQLGLAGRSPTGFLARGLPSSEGLRFGREPRGRQLDVFWGRQKGRLLLAAQGNHREEAA